MIGPGLRLRSARLSDLSAVQATLADASRWEAARGFPHPWPVPFPEERLGPAIERGDVFLLSDEQGQPVATVTLQWDDPRIWGERPPDAGYVHRLAVRRAFAGRQIGSGLLAWADATVRERGRTFVRLDCLRDAPRLHEYYAAHGYRRVGDTAVAGLELALFEKTVDRPHRSLAPNRPA